MRVAAVSQFAESLLRIGDYTSKWLAPGRPTGQQRPHSGKGTLQAHIKMQGCGSKFPSGNRDGLQIRSEGQKTAVTILHYKPARFPRHVGESPSELHALGGVLSIKRVRIFDVKVGVEQFVWIFIGIGCGRLGAAEMNRALVAINDGVDRRMLPRAQTFEAKLVLVIGESGRNVHSEELRRDLTDHEPSLVQIPERRIIQVAVEVDRVIPERIDDLRHQLIGNFESLRHGGIIPRERVGSIKQRELRTFPVNSSEGAGIHTVPRSLLGEKI
jgi:hypothetical protein